MDHAIWRRLRPIPFAVTITTPDRALPAALLDELPGILNWALAGCRSWQKKGLRQAPAIVEAIEFYRTEMDVVEDFLQDVCVRTPKGWQSSSDLWEAYERWVISRGEPVTFGASEFGKRLKAKGYASKRRTVNGTLTRGWTGITLRKDAR